MRKKIFLKCIFNSEMLLTFSVFQCPQWALFTVCFLHLFSLKCWADFHCCDCPGFGAVLSRQLTGALRSSWAGSLTLPRWAGSSPALKQQGLSWQSWIHLTSHLCLVSAPHNPRRWKCFGGFGFGLFVYFPNKLRFSRFTLIPGALHCMERKAQTVQGQCKQTALLLSPKMLFNVLLPPVSRR